MKRRPIILIVMLGLCAPLLFSGSQKPHLVAIKGGTIIPVKGENIEGGTILIKDRWIEAVGKDIEIPPEAKIIPAEGLFVFPGMIDGYSRLGLQEISSLRATIDYRETGDINPQLRCVEALRPDSMHIPIARANGITASLVAPSGGLISGQSGLIRLMGLTPEDMVIRSPVAMHINLPTLPRPSRFRRETQPREEASKKIIQLKELFNKARFYQKRKEYAEKNVLLPVPEFDEKLEFLLPVVNGELPVMISVHGEKDIRDAIKFVQEEKLKAIFYGVSEGWKVAEEIGKSGIPVVFGSLYAMPSKWEDGYDALYRNPAELSKAGVTIAFSSSSASLAKDLPYHAANAVAFGLDRREALKAVTLYPAQIFGVGDIMGSLEEGKLANIVVADGDILELRTHIKHVFIEGKEADLKTRYEKLLEKYKKD
ncbi:MAG: amidohydrolase family protein [Candidatus Aminicenantales bacterium]